MWGKSQFRTPSLFTSPHARRYYHLRLKAYLSRIAPSSERATHDKVRPGVTLGLGSATRPCRRSSVLRHSRWRNDGTSPPGRHSRREVSLPEQPGTMSATSGATRPVLGSSMGISPELCVPACMHSPCGISFLDVTSTVRHVDCSPDRHRCREHQRRCPRRSGKEKISEERGKKAWGREVPAAV